MKNFLEIAGNVHLAYFVEAADKLGIDYDIIVHRLAARFEYEGKHWFITNTVVPINNTPSTRLSKSKRFTSLILSKAGIQTPPQKKLETLEDALEFFREHTHIVIKPEKGLGGHGISILPKDEQGVKTAYEDAYNYIVNHANKVLAEKFVRGLNYRVLVLDDKVLAVVRRLPAKIVGNGINSIKTLIDLENDARRQKIMSPIPIDHELEHKLQSENMTMDTIPNNEEVVYLRFNANMTTGGTTEECTEETHPFYKDLCIKAVEAMGLKYGGVDLITSDINNPVEEYAINEINHNPGLRVHYKVDKGNVIDVALETMKYIRDNYR